MHRRSTLEEVYGPTRLPATQNGSVPNHVLSGVRILCCSDIAATALPGTPTRKLLSKQLYCCAYSTRRMMLFRINDGDGFAKPPGSSRTETRWSARTAASRSVPRARPSSASAALKIHSRGRKWSLHSMNRASPTCCRAPLREGGKPRPTPRLLFHGVLLPIAQRQP